MFLTFDIVIKHQLTKHQTSIMAKQNIRDITIIGKVNTSLEFVSIKSIKGSFLKTVKSEADKNTGVVIEWATWHAMSDKTRVNYNFIVFSKKSDWCEDVWQSSSGKDLATNIFYNYDNIVVAGSGKHIKRVMEAVGGHYNPTRLIAIPSKSSKSGHYGILSGDTEYFRDVDESDNVHIYVN